MPRPKKKTLLTTIPVENIALTARVDRRRVTTRTPEECFYAANNIEYINGFSLPNYATRFLKSNVPSMDVLEYPTWDEYRDALAGGGYDAVGISFWTYTTPEGLEMARMAREAGVREVWGGGHGINTPGAAQHFDRVFKGYSEYELKPLVEGEELRDFRHPILDSKYDFHLADVPTGFLFSIRGCRFHCSFCSGPNYYQRLAETPIEEVERVLDVYAKQGIRHITVVDETFLQRPQHARRVLEALKAREMTFTCTSRVDVLIKNVDDLKRYGLKNVYIGIESMDDQSLASVRKGLRSGKTEDLLRRLETLGCFAFGTYMLCLENDRPESVQAAVEKLATFPALYGVVFWIATPFPGTSYYDEAEAAGEILDREPKHYDALHLVRKHPHLDPPEARRLLEWCVKSHCHEQNLRKYKILRRWEKLERQGAANEKLPPELEPRVRVQADGSGVVPKAAGPGAAPAKPVTRSFPAEVGAAP
jgi:pyruvate-formate lyase-activating enzyme